MENLSPAGQQQERISFWYDPKKRGILFQALALLVVGFGVGLLIYNTQQNLAEQNIASGFGFLGEEAGFEISESMFEYWADDSYLFALWIGVLNTLKIALLGNFLAVSLGVVVGVLRLSSNWLVSKLSQTYIEAARNVPLLLQLFFWYAVFTEIFPRVRQAYEILPGFFVSQRGFVFPVFADHPVWKYVWLSLFFGACFVAVMQKLLRKRREEKGEDKPLWPYLLVGLVAFPVITWLIGGAPLALNVPEMGGFNFSGGMSFTPEFVALLLGLVLYTGAFNAEIVRAGIESVSKGQWEAAESLGLTRTQVLRLVVLPQSLRVIVPPLTSQILNLIKNSSLAVGIGYPDFVAVANTTMNQTGQAIEGVLMIMAVYLVFSLGTSLVMNLYNRKIRLEEGRS